MEIMVNLFGNIYKGKKVFITGNTGFKGSWLTEFLLMLGAKIKGYSIDVPSKPSIYEENQLGNRIKQVWGDVRKRKLLENSILEFKPDFIFHLAAQALVKESYQDPFTTFETNVMGTINIMDVARKITHPCKIVLITSDKCYENVEWTWGYRENDRLGGKDPYSASKGAAELAIHAYIHSYFKKLPHLKIASARAGNVIGGGDWAADRIVPDCFRFWANNEPVIIRSPKATRPWQHVLEPLSGYLRLGQMLCFEEKCNGEAYNFGPASEQSKSVLELLQILSSYWNTKDIPSLFDIKENPDIHEAGLLKLNCDKALHDLDWLPTLTFKETSELTAKWYTNFYQEKKISSHKLTLKHIEDYIEIATKRNRSWVK